MLRASFRAARGTFRGSPSLTYTLCIVRPTRPLPNHPIAVRGIVRRRLCTEKPKEEFKIVEDEVEKEAPIAFREAPLQWMNQKQRKMRAVFMRYSVLALTFYFTLYVITLSTIYGLVHIRVIKIPDPTPTLKKILPKSFGDFELSPFLYQFAGAWILTKTTEPARLILTLAVVPWLARRLPPTVLRAFGVRLTNVASNARDAYKNFRNKDP